MHYAIDSYVARITCEENPVSWCDAVEWQHKGLRAVFEICSKATQALSYTLTILVSSILFPCGFLAFLFLANFSELDERMALFFVVFSSACNATLIQGIILVHRMAQISEKCFEIKRRTVRQSFQGNTHVELTSRLCFFNYLDSDPCGYFLMGKIVDSTLVAKFATGAISFISLTLYRIAQVYIQSN